MSVPCRRAQQPPGKPRSEEVGACPLPGCPPGPGPAPFHSGFFVWFLGLLSLAGIPTPALSGCRSCLPSSLSGSPSPLAPLALAPLSPWLTSRVMSCQAGLMDGGPPRGAPPLPSPSPHLSLHHLFQRQGRPPRGTGPLDKPVAEVGWGDKPVLQWLLQIRNIPAPSGRSLKEERCF